MRPWGVAQALVAVAQRQDGVVTWDQARRHGETEGTVRAHLRTGRWTRVRQGAYLISDATTVRDPWVQARAAALTVPGAVIAGRSAARLWRVDGLPDGAVEIAVPRRRTLRSRPDLLVRCVSLEASDVVEVRGLRLTSPARTLQDVVLGHDRLTGVAAVDSALRRGLVRPGDLPALAAGCLGRPGSRATADVWSLADGRAESVLESRVRVRCVDGGLPPEELQLEIRDERGVLQARVDLAYRTRRRPGRGLLVVEADGSAVHGSADAAFADRERGNRLAGLGHDMLRFTYRDTGDALTIPRAVRAAL